MSVVTYIPRALPVFLLKYIKLNRRMEYFLKLIPFTVMGALIFPGILTVADHYLIGIAGGIAAIFISWKYNKITYVILSAVLTAAVLNWITG
jgi:branched-subunit amino acid transport protein